MSARVLLARYYDPATGQFLDVDPKVQQTLEAFEYVTNDPVSADDPTGQSVNLAGVATWAEQNLHRATEYYGNDCTDFVSQALFYGGNDPQNVGPNAVEDTANLRYWFFIWSPRAEFVSLSWRVAPDLARHFQLNGSHWLVEGGTTPNKSAGQWSLVRPGDVIFANWSGNGFTGISHCGVIVSVLKGSPYLQIAQHTIDRIDTLTVWLRAGSDTHVWIVDPNPR